MDNATRERLIQDFLDNVSAHFDRGWIVSPRSEFDVDENKIYAGDLLESIQRDKEGGTTRVWIVQRCTQQMVDHPQLQYQDWGPYGAGTMTPMTKSEMLKALDVFQRRWPDEEFRGHNVVNCKCHRVYPAALSDRGGDKTSP
jgi:hypothetical protein